ncbi:MAG: hypothetical protein MZW92_36915, partial [Comamonadaceae bacterium]|nr:hypothetical protein [Comamonadaceae bacterium]
LRHKANTKIHWTTSSAPSEPDPASTAANRARRISLERHVAFERFAPQVLYELRIKEGLHRFHPDMPPSPIWGYDGIFPGPTFRSRYGAPAIVRNVDELPQNHVGYGIPRVSTHLHNAHNPSMSDGFACNYFPQQAGGVDSRYDYHYPHARAGFSSGAVRSRRGPARIAGHALVPRPGGLHLAERLFGWAWPASTS